MTAGAASATAALRSRVLSGLAWKFASQTVLQVARMAVAIALARLLTPRDYGLAAMALVVSSIVLAFSDLGLGAPLVQRLSITEKDRSTVFWVSIGVGSLLTALGIAAAGPIARFYGEPEVRALFAVLSLSFFVTALGATQKALLTREMDFRSLELRMIAGTLGGGAVGIVVAARGGGAWALVIQQLTAATLATILLWLVSPWRPAALPSLASLRRLGGFSANVFGQRLLYQLTRSADNVLIGRFLGPAAVGVYALAYNIMLAPLSRLGAPLSEVLFPAFSRMQEDRARIAAVWIRATRLLAAVALPAMLGLIIVADELVGVVLGARWSAAVPVIQILAWVGLLQAVQTLNEDVLQALDRTSTMFRFMCVWSVSSVTAFVIGLHWGVVGVAACFAIANTILFPVSIWLPARAAGISVRSFARGLAGVVQAAVVMAIVVLLARLALLETDAAAGVRLVLLVLVGGAVYLPLLAWRAPETFGEVKRLRARPAAGPA
jgi:polysaccharide transporter, PST family